MMTSIVPTLAAFQVSRVAASAARGSLGSLSELRAPSRESIAESERDRQRERLVSDLSCERDCYGIAMGLMGIPCGGLSALVTGAATVISAIDTGLSIQTAGWFVGTLAMVGFLVGFERVMGGSTIRRLKRELRALDSEEISGRPSVLP